MGDVETVTVRMTRTDHSVSWGFRLQGGHEFNQPLVISKVIEGSLADRAGLQEGDRVRQIGGRNAEGTMSHGEAQQLIMACAHNLDMVTARETDEQDFLTKVKEFFDRMDILLNHRNVSTIQSPEFPKIPGADITTTSRIGGVPTMGQTQEPGYTTQSKSYTKKTSSRTTTTSPGVALSPTFGAAQPPTPKPYTPSAAPFTTTTTTTTTSMGGRPAASPGGLYQQQQQQQQQQKFDSSWSKKTAAAASSTYDYQSTSTSGGGNRHLSPVPFAARAPSPVGGAGGQQPRPKSPVAYDYLNKTGGLFGIDQKLASPKEQPSFMKSETLKLIQEEQKGGTSLAPQSPVIKHVEPPPPSSAPLSSPPVCENCGQKIIGVFCKAGGKTLHGECFNCSTCGTSLKNIGYFLINEKLYCELHAKQQQHSQFKATPPMDPNLYATYGAPSRSPRPTETGKSPTSIQQRSEAFTKSSTYASNTLKPATGKVSPVQRAYSPVPFQPAAASQRSTYTSSQYTAAAGDAVQMFGPKTPGRGRGILKQLQEGPRIPVCESCNREIRGPFVLAMNTTWCPDHFVCATPSCQRQLIDTGFIELNGTIYCEHCYEKFYAPTCSKCQRTIMGDCLTALSRRWHPDCFTCVHCHKPFGNNSFFLENGQPYCETDWNALFTTKCNNCHFPIEAGDRWVEALGHSYHSDCFCCTICQKTLEGQSFYAKGGRPYCKAHA